MALSKQDPQGNLPADAILALLEQAGDYEVDAFQATRMLPAHASTGVLVDSVGAVKFDLKHRIAALASH